MRERILNTVVILLFGALPSGIVWYQQGHRDGVKIVEFAQEKDNPSQKQEIIKLTADLEQARMDIKLLKYYVDDLKSKEAYMESVASENLAQVH